ncbi:hypothetical protein E3N88_12177 [Mikania micrantha]|uniref:Uncharacterized protein n=1 Tax=Mikania micrantha TaxID=192012 RepID=A0A5N6P634_9ASTR|nr:hypothetical protein E3N88_12177 [Mikania micrantha]
MWWDGVWAGRRLDSGVCPIHKHTELDDTGDVNEVKVVTEEVINVIMCFKLLNIVLSISDDHRRKWVDPTVLSPSATRRATRRYQKRSRLIGDRLKLFWGPNPRGIELETTAGGDWKQFRGPGGI